MHTQLIISLISIAAAAAVALVCDYMRARNAQLREEMDRLAPKAAKRVHRATAGPRRAARPGSKIIPIEATQPLRPLPIELRAEAEPEPQPKLEPQHPSESGLKPNSALSTWLIDRAVGRAAQQTEGELTRAPKLETTPVSASVDTQLRDLIAAIDPSNQTKPEGSKSDKVVEMIHMKVPAGMHAPAVLSQVVESRQPFTGLVISIGVSAKDSREASAEDLAFSVEPFIAGLLRSSDFGCRVDRQEFLLLCPGPRAAEAQLHLSHISERLWDYQLRTLGKLSLVFNMGGTDVQGESLADAIVSAKQRMSQSRRGANSNSMSLVPQRKKAI